jgi:hypothetical protein
LHYWEGGYLLGRAREAAPNSASGAPTAAAANGAMAARSATCRGSRGSAKAQASVASKWATMGAAASWTQARLLLTDDRAVDFCVFLLTFSRCSTSES